MGNDKVNDKVNTPETTSPNHTPEEIRGMLIQAASLAVKQSREGRYVGAGCVADAILTQTEEAKAHRMSIEQTMACVTDLLARTNHVQQEPQD